MRKFILSVVLAYHSIAGATWPDAPWLNNLKPVDDAKLHAVIFGSPFDLLFIKSLAAWKKLQKKYEEYGVEFLVVTHPENDLPYSDIIVKQALQSLHLGLPVFVDYGSSYSKKWRAYVTPTVDLVLKDEKVVSFDPGNFDPVSFEKALQKALKEAGVSKLPPREYTNEAEFKNCPHGNTFSLGEKQKSVWGTDPVEVSDNWSEKNLYVMKTDSLTGSITLTLKDPNLAVLAESTNHTTQTLKISFDNLRAVKGSDVQENKSGEFILPVNDFRLYEVLSSADASSFKNQKIKFTTDSKNLKIWAFQTIPHCRNLK